MSNITEIVELDLYYYQYFNINLQIKLGLDIFFCTFIYSFCKTTIIKLSL